MLSHRETGRHFSSVTIYSAIAWCTDAVLAGVSVSNPGTWPAWVDVESCLWRCCPRGSSGSLLMRQTFKADDSLHSGKPTDYWCEDRTETDDSTTGRGADIRAGGGNRGRHTSQLFDFYCHDVTDIMTAGRKWRLTIADADCRDSVWPSSWLCALPFVGVNSGCLYERPYPVGLCNKDGVLLYGAELVI